MKVRVTCSECKRIFLRPSGRVHEARKFNWNQYCSPPCMTRSKNSGLTLQCGNPRCGNKFYRSLNEIRKVKNSYCSHACAASVNNQRFPKKSRDLHACANKTCNKRVRSDVKYCSRYCFNLVRTTHSTKALTQKLQSVSQELGRAPAKREVGSIADMCVRAFGSWNQSLVVAGLTPHRSHSQRMYKRTSTVATDGHTCDSISEAIVDNWLTKNNISHLRNTSYPDTKHRADWSIKKNVFIEYFGLANDSPRYDQSIQEKRRLCEKHNIQLIEIYPTDLYPDIKLDAKFKLLL
ncbi:MAG: hypothetical protein Q8Q13_01250 [bacterium]|nr:hypothetical protein [bacterium]